jgi:hypothetical protein
VTDRPAGESDGDKQREEEQPQEYFGCVSPRLATVRPCHDRTLSHGGPTQPCGLPRLSLRARAAVVSGRACARVPSLVGTSVRGRLDADEFALEPSDARSSRHLAY